MLGGLSSQLEGALPRDSGSVFLAFKRFHKFMEIANLMCI